MLLTTDENNGRMSYNFEGGIINGKVQGWGQGKD